MRIKIIILTALLILSVSSSYGGGLIVNELLVDEPSSNITLEWIELYNDSSEAVSLLTYEFKYGSTTVNLPDSVNIAPGEYYIICRRLYQSGTTPGFESFWGDGSDVWGDTPFETSLQKPYETTFSLPNGGGFVSLVKEGTEVSPIFWNTVGQDGYSLERLAFNSNTILPSEIRFGTPGSLNSVTKAPTDLAVDSVIVSSIDSTTFIDYLIINKGMNNVSLGYLLLKLRTSELVIDSIDLPTILAGDTLIISREYSLVGLYIAFTAELSDDDRLYNNAYNFMGVGNMFPPIMITEFMANPDSELKTEWVELKNISNAIVDLWAWRIGDSNNLYQISQTSVLLNPGDYIILADSEIDFLNYYSDFSGQVVQPDQWPTLNNSGDIVRLADMYQIEADRFEYSEVYDQFNTWSYDEVNNVWGRSTDFFGSPGEQNSVFISAGGDELNVELSSSYISPDNDGFEDQLDITIDIPQSDMLTVEIYDRHGRVVKTFFEDISDPADFVQIQWDGLSNGGSRLPIGMYILFVKTSDQSKKIPVVVAR